MVIGTKSTSTIFDMFQTGVKEVIRAMGLPTELSFSTPGAVITAKSSEFDKKIEFYKIDFDVKEGTDPNALAEILKAAKIPHQIAMNNGQCAITLPEFYWRHLPQLAPMDTMVQEHAAYPLRSRSWQVEIKTFKRFDFNVNVLIEQMLETNASDIHMRAGSPPYMRHDGDLKPMDLPSLSADDMREVVYQLGGDAQVQKLNVEKEISFQYHLAGIGYLRCSGYIKMGAMALAIRFIPERPLPLEKLDLPPAITRLTTLHRGLFLVCGVTGSGKSTTLSSMVDHINARSYRHIITIEDPIEFVYTDKKAIISQRQVGRDTHSFANALRGALREDPDVILVGEMRDQETIRAALSAAATGHLVMSTLHTMTAVDTINRIISYFPQAERDVVRQELAYSLVGVCCQRLLKRIGGGRIPCCELLLADLPMVRDAILEADIDRLNGVMEV
ncbi:MAG: PilT/PilU family type 4a pilus ATPase, partial [Candidatus Hydrogenedentales bacterium]